MRITILSILALLMSTSLIQAGNGLLEILLLNISIFQNTKQIFIVKIEPLYKKTPAIAGITQVLPMKGKGRSSSI